MIQNVITEILNKKDMLHNKPPLKIKVGDNVTFKALTAWSSGKATRKVKAITDDGRIIVRFGGWDSFSIRPHEIISVN